VPDASTYRLPCCNRAPEVGEFIMRNDRDPPGYVTCAGCSFAAVAGPDQAEALRGLPLVIPAVRLERLKAKATANTPPAEPTAAEPTT